MELTWHDARNFSVNGVPFSLVNLMDDHTRAPHGHRVFKDAWMVRQYAGLLARLEPSHVIELGIYQGGSTVLLHCLSQASKMVAVDIASERVASLDRYIADGNEHSLAAFYGVDQSNRFALGELVQSEFGSESLDLVVDDASHFYEETTASFNLLFPRLRRGGVYVIEDWSWGHLPMAEQPPFAEQEPLTRLVLEIVMACPANAGLIQKVEINRNSALVWRGGAELGEEFRIGATIRGRARSLLR